MATALDYSTILGNMNEAVATGSGVTHDLGLELRTSIASLGAALTTRFTSEVGDAKDAWQAVASSAFAEAQKVTDYAYTEAGESVPSAITFNPYDSAELLARIKAAESLEIGRLAKRALAAHKAAFISAFAVGGAGAAAYAETGAAVLVGGQRRSLSVAELERNIYDLLAQAGDWLILHAQP